MAAYEIPISPAGFELIAAKANEAADAVGGLDQNVERLNSHLRESGAASQGLRAGRYRFSSLEDDAGSPRAAAEAASEEKRRRMEGFTRERSYWIQSGANQRLEKARRGLQIAEDTGDESLTEDARASLIRAERARERQQRLLEGGSGREGALWEALQSSRLGPGGQLMPLMNRLRSAGLSSAEELMDHYGISAEQAAAISPRLALAGRIAGPLGAIVAGGYAGYRLAEDGSARMQAGASAYWGTGSSPEDAGRVIALGGPEGAQKARAFGDSLRESTYGAQYFRSRGIYDLGGATVDKGSNYIRAIDELRRIPNDRDAIRIARDMGLERELRYRDLDNTTYARLRDSMEDAGSDRERRASTQYESEKDILRNYWDKLVRDVTLPLVTTASELLGGNVFEQSAAAGRLLNPVNYLTNAIRLRAETSAIESNDEKNKRRREQQNKSNPADANQFIPVGMSPRFYGGAERAPSAVPPGAARAALSKDLDFQAINLGAAGFS